MDYQPFQAEEPRLPSAAEPGGGRPGLTMRNFRKISCNGFGDPLNAYPHSMSWFKDHLYVGTTRANLHLLWFTMGENVNRFAIWPVEHPDNPYDLDLRAQVWRFDPRQDEWRQVYLSPLLMGTEGFEVPLSIGFRGITVFQGRRDPEPALYLTTWASSKGPGPVLLRSYDGVNFTPVSRPGLGDPTVSTIRAVVPMNGKLFLAPTGTTKGKYLANVPDRMVILVNDDPEAGDWELAGEPFFGDPTNQGIFDMAAFQGHLYAATTNSATGFQIWKTRAEGKPPYRWRQVMTQGGYRGRENQGVGHLCVYQDCLYVSTGILGGHDREHNIGPASPELFRIYPDDTWDLVVGEPRLTPEGLKAPLSGLGPGFNSPTVGYFWRMCEHRGWLYLGTYDYTIWMPYVRPDTIPEKLRQRIERVGVDNIVRAQAGFDLWRSRDGVQWVPVSRNGFGNPCNYGVRTMASSPYGLFVGVANPFGPTMATRRLTGWRYEPHAGGCEVWLGSYEIPEPSGENGIDQGLLRLGGGRGRRSLAELAEDSIARFYEGSGFRQCGFWSPTMRTPKQACENLAAELLALLPEAPASLLEIGCGSGAFARMLTKAFPRARVAGTVENAAELAACRDAVPAGDFQVQKPGKVKFSPGGFEAAVCVEGPSRYQPLGKFLARVQRVLRPGGLWVFADLVPDGALGGTAPLGAYEALLRAAGFIEIQLWDMTRECWQTFLGYAKTEWGTKLVAGEITQDLYQEILGRLPGGMAPGHAYLMGRARKIW